MGVDYCFCKFYHDYRKFAKLEKCNHNTSNKQSKKEYFYVIEPECHGNGGWCGSHVVKEYTSLEKALKSKPRWRPEHSPYDGHILNHPRLSQSTYPNEATHIFNWDLDEWKTVNKYD
jgi:hypothetical protein